MTALSYLRCFFKVVSAVKDARYSILNRERLNLNSKSYEGMEVLFELRSLANMNGQRFRWKNCMIAYSHNQSEINLILVI